MSFNSTYRPLFELVFRHQYFLDEGTDKFKENLNQEWMVTNLKSFSLSSFLTIVPTKNTSRILKNWRGQFVFGKDSITVLLRTENSDNTKPFIEFSDDLIMDFLVEIRDPFFVNYTDLDIDSSKLIMVSNKEPDNSVKENAKLTTFYPLSEFGDPDESSEISVDFEDVIDDKELIGKLAVIRIHLEGDVDEMQLTENSMTEFASDTPSEIIKFKNRRTRWKYITTSDGTELFKTGKKPLTKNGYIKITHNSTDYPNPTPNLIGYDSDGDYYYSEIFI